jgi:hypothetical protein
MVPQNHTTKVLILQAELCAHTMTEKVCFLGRMALWHQITRIPSKPLYNQPKQYSDQDNPIGEVIGSNHAGFREAQVGNAQAWYYHADKTIILWECFFDDRFRKLPLPEDANIQRSIYSSL